MEILEAVKQIMGQYPQIRQRYYDEVFVAVYDYLDSDRGIAAFKNSMIRAVSTAFPATGDVAWEDGGQELPIDPELSDYIAALQEAELANISVLFQNLKGIRGEEGLLKFEYSTQRAEGYASTLDHLYSYIKIAAGKDVMLTLVGDDGEKSCKECQQYKGKRHRASWWVKRNLVPGIGSAYSCGGWNCQHTLVDDSGTIWSL